MQQIQLIQPLPEVCGQCRFVTDIADACSAYDLENKVIGTVGAGRIGQRVLSRLQASRLFKCPSLAYLEIRGCLCSMQKPGRCVFKISSLHHQEIQKFVLLLVCKHRNGMPMSLFPFSCFVQGFAPKKLLYSDYARLPEKVEQDLKAEYAELEDLVK